MKYWQKIFFFLISLSFIFIANPAKAVNSLLISPLQGRYEVGTTFMAKLWLKVDNYPINKFFADIVFDEDFIEISSLEMASFVTSDSTASSSFNNKAGLASVAGLINGGMKEDGAVAKIYFKVKQKGMARVRLKQTSKIFTNEGWQVSLTTGPSTYQLLEKDSSTSVDKEDTKYIITSEEGGFSGISNKISSSSALVGNPPFLKGVTDILSARIEFDIDDGLIVDRVFTNSQGIWSWYLPRILPAGNYAIKITAIHPEDIKKRHIQWVESEVRVLDAALALYKIYINTSTLPQSPSPGDQITLDLHMPALLGNTDNKKQFRLSYYIEDADNNIFYENEEDIIHLGKKLELSKTIHLPKGATEGKYIIYVNIKYNDEMIFADSASFTVSSGFPKYAFFSFLGLVIILITVGVMLIRR